MEPVQAVILGIIQGLTEFLPVSSSGHLVIFQHLFGLREPELFFDVSVHMGTLTAVIIFFWKDIQAIILSVLHFLKLLIKREVSFKDINNTPELKLALLILIGSVPTGIIGLLFHKAAEQIFSSLFLVGCALILTGLILWLTRPARSPTSRFAQVGKNDKDINQFSIKDALIIGTVQGVAIIPGISRSGSTIATGFFLGLTRELSARYSFLLSIPAIIGAEMLSLKDVSASDLNPAAFIGTLTAGIVGYGALKLLVYIVKKGEMHLFAPYCWLAGLLALCL